MWELLVWSDTIFSWYRLRGNWSRDIKRVGSYPLQRHSRYREVLSARESRYNSGIKNHPSRGHTHPDCRPIMNMNGKDQDTQNHYLMLYNKHWKILLVHGSCWTASLKIGREKLPQWGEGGGVWETREGGEGEGGADLLNVPNFTQTWFWVKTIYAKKSVNFVMLKS